ncbi:hypothetical protein GQX74_009211 [Glossina fuscipes]|nr:hypothetical protein GQX74_009211 [Glossina fuscipes]
MHLHFRLPNAQMCNCNLTWLLFHLQCIAKLNYDFNTKIKINALIRYYLTRHVLVLFSIKLTTQSQIVEDGQKPTHWNLLLQSWLRHNKIHLNVFCKLYAEVLCLQVIRNL